MMPPGHPERLSPLEPTPLAEPLCDAIRAGLVRTIVISGGTFDPPHRAHTELAALARAHVDATDRGPGAAAAPDGPHAWLLFIPAARSPFKSAGPAASDEDRLAMLRLALAGVVRAAIWTDEIDRARILPGSASYTIDTIDRLQREIGRCGGRAGLRLLLGTDQAIDFHRWRSAREIIERAEPLVMLRSAARDDNAEQGAATLDSGLRQSGFWTPDEISGWARRVAPIPLIDISATRVRDAVRRMDTDPSARPWLRTALHPAVLKYIESWHLYR